jgi:RNA-directed DNA polymerase
MWFRAFESSSTSVSPRTLWPQKDGRRRGEHEHTSFTFLGYAFRARGARSKGRNFTGFLPAMSPEALRAKSAELRRMRIHRRTDLSLDDLAGWLNPIASGWINYYGRFYRTALDPLLKRVNVTLRRWAGNTSGCGPTSASAGG